MYTPAQLRERLLELGIHRDLRTLTNWRQNGLLPRLQRIGAGRGRGAKWFWHDDPLEQAIAIGWLLRRSGRMDETLLGLWLAGYHVDPVAAQRAWIQHLKREQHRRQRAAFRYSGGFYGLGRSWWRRLQSDEVLRTPWQDYSASDRKVLGDLLGDSQEWMRDDSERDDDAYKNQIAELIIRLAKADRDEVYEWIDDVWKVLDPASLFAITPSIKFIQSISQQERNAANESLVDLASALQQALELVPIDRVNRVMIRVAVMGDFLGPLVAKLRIQVSRQISALPFRQIFLLLHDFVKGVQSTDIITKTDGTLGISERARMEWEATKKKLSQLLTPIGG